MATNQTTDVSGRVYRVDRFTVPARARDAFLEKVNATHALLKTQPGFIQDFLIERDRDSGGYDILTFVEWESAAAIERAKEAVAELHEEAGFDPREMLDRLGIEADRANYRPVAS